MKGYTSDNIRNVALVLLPLPIYTAASPQLRVPAELIVFKAL